MWWKALFPFKSILASAVPGLQFHTLVLVRGFIASIFLFRGIDRLLFARDV